MPLALALISVSNPKLQILDTLSKFSHDSDPEVAHNAIIAMGLVGAGEVRFKLNACLIGSLILRGSYLCMSVKYCFH